MDKQSPPSRRLPEEISEHIPKLRIQISQLIPLILTDSSPRRPIPLPILPRNQRRIRTTTRSTQTNEPNTDTITRLILWRILAQEAIRRHDPTNISKPNLPRTTDSATVMTAQVHVEPADNHRHRRVRPHDDEEERAVLQGQVVVHREEDGKARDGDANGEDGEEEAVAREIGEYGDEHGEAESDGPGGNGVELCLYGAVVVGGDDGWAEEGISVGGSMGFDEHVKSKMGENKSNFEVQV